MEYSTSLLRTSWGFPSCSVAAIVFTGLDQGPNIWPPFSTPFQPFSSPLLLSGAFAEWRKAEGISSWRPLFPWEVGGRSPSQSILEDGRIMAMRKAVKVGIWKSYLWDGRWNWWDLSQLPLNGKHSKHKQIHCLLSEKNMKMNNTGCLYI